MNATYKPDPDLERRLSRSLLDVFDLPAVVQSLQPKLGDLAKNALGFVASIGGAMLLFLASFIIAGIIMAFGQSGARGMRSIFDRIVGTGHGEEFAKLSTATIRAVALGVLGVAFIQAIAVGLLMMIAGVPFAGLLALIVLVLGIAQVPALLVTLPVIVYIWVSGSTVPRRPLLTPCCCSSPACSTTC